MNLARLLGAAVAAVWPVLAVAQSARPEAFVPRHVTLVLRVEYTDPHLAGSIRYELRNWTSRPDRTVSFILNRLMDVSAVRDSAGKNLRFTQHVVRFRDDPRRQVTQVIVTLAHDIASGATATLRLDYAGYLTGYTEVGWLYVRDRIDTAFTIIRADALAFPVVGGITDAANRKAPPANFTYDASVTVPPGFVVATGGTMLETPSPDGAITWRYVSTAPSPFLNIAIAPFDTLSADGVRIFYFRPDSAGARRVMSRAQAGLRLLTDWFGPLHAPVNLAITEIPDGWGSQASAIGGIIQTASAFRDTTRVGELYHELSHLWNARDMDSPSPRWNEGLATFLERQMREQLDGWTGRPAFYQGRIAGLRAAVAEDSSLRRVPFIDYGANAMTGASYRVGDLMFATLYEIIGRGRFNQVVGGYYQQFSGGGTTREFVSFVLRAAPDLSGFFDEWMFTTRWTDRLSAGSVEELAASYRRQ